MNGETDRPRKRPKRLWFAAFMNTVLSLTGLYMVAYLSIYSHVPYGFRPSQVAALLSVATAGFLIASSILALLGTPRWDGLMLAAAVLYYGGILTQNIYLLIQVQDTAIPTQPLVSHAVRSGLALALALAINLWAVRSAKTRAHFRHAS